MGRLYTDENMINKRNIAFLFPGQGAQYVGMGKDFASAYPIARETFEEAEDILNSKLSKIIFEGPENALTLTVNSQPSIYAVSMALLRVLQQTFPDLNPTSVSGLSLGEYSALTASRKISFPDGLQLVQHRAQFMNDACEAVHGTMAVVMGLDANEVEKMIEDLNLPNDLWAANFNCPGQIVISGTIKGIEKGSEEAKARGAKRVIPLQVHGAFHSGLMQSAEDRLAEYVKRAELNETACALVMNVPGDFVKDSQQIRKNLIKQVSHSVRWEQGIRQLQQSAVDLYIEIGCGKTLSGLNKRIGVSAPTLTLDKVEDLKIIEEALSK